MQQAERRANYWYLINSVIGVSLMLFFKFIPAPAPITPIGMEVLGIFFGVIYLWTTCDSIWPSLVGVSLLGISSYAPMNTILMNFLGDSTVVQMLFIMVLVGAVVQSGLTNYIGRWFLTRKIINGKPWVFSFMLLLGVYVLAFLSSAFAPTFLFWPILYGIFKELDYKPGDKYPTLMLIAVVITAIFGVASAPFKDVPLILLSNYKNVSGVEVNYASYMGLTIPLSLICLTVLILFMKYVLRPDVTSLKAINAEMFNKNPLPPLTFKHKLLATAFGVFVILMLLPGILPAGPLQQFFNDNKFGFAVLLVGILCGLKLEGKFVIDYQTVMSTQVQWSTVFLIAAALTIGNALTSEATGVTPFLKQTLTPIFGGTSEFVFIAMILVIGLILTNLCNSAVIGMIFIPIIFTFCGTMGISADPIVSIFIFLVLMALVTPAASPYAALIHGNKTWFKTSDIYKYTTIISAVMLLIILVIGIPLSKLVF